jgi:ABC transport system ATP-binding/permease protein
LAALHAEMGQPEYYRQPSERIAEKAAHLKQLESQLANAYERWEELDQFAE